MDSWHAHDTRDTECRAVRGATIRSPGGLAHFFAAQVRLDADGVPQFGTARFGASPSDCLWEIGNEIDGERYVMLLSLVGGGGDVLEFDEEDHPAFSAGVWPSGVDGRDPVDDLPCVLPFEPGR